LEKRISNKWKIDIESISKTGHIPGTHAEVRALNELLWRLQNEKGLIITDDIVNDILGYNKNYSTVAIMPRCADCFFITKDFKMIMSN
jgi:predicted HAD superfamily phosphohydrolase YqeG